MLSSFTISIASFILPINKNRSTNVYTYLHSVIWHYSTLLD
nr:MAG TPA: hypothetical protein [Caudoviricetes sp.]